MTSYSVPDYYARFELTPEEFQNLSGMAFSVSITLDDRDKKVKGMIIIPQGDKSPERSGRYNAWLWLDKYTELPLTTVLHAKLLSPCDPITMPVDEHELKKYHGIILTGEITKNNTA